MKTQNKPNLFDFDRKTLESYFVDLGEKSFRAHQLLKWIYQCGVIDIELMTNFSNDLRSFLKENVSSIFIIMMSLLSSCLRAFSFLSDEEFGN